MTKKKLTTEEILAQLRAQKAGGGAEAPQAGEPAEESPTAEQPAAEAPAEKPAPAKPAAPKPAGGAPKSTADILAAARAQSGSGAAPAKPAAAKPAAPKPAGGAPKSTADILAAARAQQGGGPAAEAGAPKAAAAKPAAKAAATAPAGDRPSVDEMLRKMREAKTGELIPAPTAVAAVPPMPTRPAPAAKKAAAAPETRRNFLIALVATPFAAAWTFFAVTSLAWLLALARFMMPNVLVEPPSKFKIGPPGDYPFGFVSTKFTSAFAVWVVHAEYGGKSLIYALSTVCTHLGCTPNWLEGEQKFKCPCHGSGFYITGVNFEGPAPRPLERYGIRVAEDGMLEIDKSVKFQEEKGQWADTASFVETA